MASATECPGSTPIPGILQLLSSFHSEKNAKFKWTHEAGTAFEHLHKQLTTTPVLILKQSLFLILMLVAVVLEQSCHNLIVKEKRG